MSVATPEIIARRRVMVEMRQSGMTLQAIGDQFGWSRGQVLKDINKFLKLDKDAWALAKWGCSYAHYCTLRDDPGRPTVAFAAQRRNAGLRGIPWEFTLCQWWAVWQDSGKWPERARGNGYVMCRHGDVGPYAVGNVYIATSVQNIRDGFAFRSKKLRSAA